MTQNYIWSWGSSSGALGSVVYSFIAIIPRSTPTIVVPVSEPFIGEMSLLRNYLY